MMKGDILQIKEILAHWETDHTETVVARLTAAIVFDFRNDNGEVEELVTGIRPGEHTDFSVRVIEATQEWLDAGGVVPEWVPPTAEELRELIEPISARQFRLGLVQSGRALAQMDAAIAAIPDATDRATAEIEWQFATTFNRMHPLVVSLSAALGFTPEEVDALWQSALQL